jgi:hypothetical protein
MSFLSVVENIGSYLITPLLLRKLEKALAPPQKGLATTQRNSIAPWSIGYGRIRVGGTLIYDQQWGNNNQMRDMVIELAANQCQIDANHPITLLLDMQRVQIDTAAVPTTAAAGYAIPAPNPCSGTSFTPVNQAENSSVRINSLSRANDVVTVALNADIPYLIAGDRLTVQGVNLGVSGSDQTFNGVFQVAEITNAPASHVGGAVGAGTGLTFTYLSGGIASTANVTAGPASVETMWADYGRDIYMEVMTGNQVLGQTFIGMTAGTPWQGTGKLCTPASPQLAGGTATTNPWTASCSAQGKTLVFLRLKYSSHFQAGLPQISFLVYGKNDIYDPRLGAYGATGTTGYTENAALCIADLLHTGAPLSAPWVATTSYGAGWVASFQAPGDTNGVDYVNCVSANIGNQPNTSPTEWIPVTPANLPALWSGSVTYGLGALAAFEPAGSYVTRQYVSLVASNTGNEPDTHPSQWAWIPTPVYPLPDWGYRLPYATGPTPQNPCYIDITALTAAANTCDQAVALANGGTEPMYALSGQFDLTKKRGEILQDMLTACAGRLSIIGGQYAIQPGAWTGAGAPTVNLTSMAAGPLKWRGISSRELFNGVKGTFISPQNKWASTDFPYYAQDSWHGYSGSAIYGGDINLAADGGERRWMEFHLPFTISASTAQRIAKIMLLRSRWAAFQAGGSGGAGTFALNMAGYQFAPLDIFNASVPFLWSGTKALEVAETRFRIDKNGGKPTLGIEIDVQATDSSIYGWSTSEELSAQGYSQNNFPTGTFQDNVPLPWSAGYVASLAGDAIGGAATFGVEPIYETDAQGNMVASVKIKGAAPINALDFGVAAPLITCVGNSTGGTVPAGNYVIGLAAYDSGSSSHADTDYHSLVFVSLGGTTSSITVNVTWGSGDDGGDLYMGVWQPGEGYVMHYQQTLTPGQAAATIASFNQATAGGPDPKFDHFGVLPFAVEHSGDWDGVIPSTGSIAAATVTIPAPTSTADQWTGYTLSLLGRTSGEVPVINLPVAHNTASSGGLVTFTIGAGADGNTLANLTTLLLAGDLLVMRGRYTFDATTGAFSDLNVANSYYPTGADATVEPGHVAIVLTGADAGDMRTIKSVTTDVNGNYTVFNPASPWTITPATGDLVAICSPAGSEWPSPPVTARNSSVNGVMAQPDILNLANQTWLFLVRTNDSNGNHGPDSLAPMRDVYCFGAAGNNASPGATLQIDGTLAIGSNQAPPLQLNASRTPTAVIALAGTAPTGAGITVNINVGGTLWMSLTIAAGTTSVQATTGQLTTAGAITGSSPITLDITAVGTTVPGADLSVFIYL